ncbi:Queuine tRNA-ribosyltransferase [Spironucleus salmonicida]|uniref:tRNA-guanosine(34) queuine transglycosylase n=1 Tax=Spironucleus salmonicida TaxID=348837 RepID=V6LYU9_9EUKA|nr:Queuine tRNA-ribosyltransferase [Spironucleus salmonicida]|eukprot:EST49448.1 Queuine tRNA-ribosyltransferase [Spironucleus salmonicida]
MGRGPAKYTQHKKYKHARLGTFTLAHADIATPVYMPVGTQGTLKGFTTEQIKTLNPKIMLSNTYFLNQRPGIPVLEQTGGLHNLMRWPNNFLTDSGGFQMVSLLKLSKLTEEGVTFISPVTGFSELLTPEISIKTQQAIGTDVIMCLDDVVSAQLDKVNDAERIAEASLRTTRWLDRCISAHTTQNQALFAICQGHLDCTKNGNRDQCIRDITERKESFGGIAIGGLSGGEAKDDFWRTVLYCTINLPQDLPRYLMGVGFPVDLVTCSCLGVDMFDCVYATRTGRFGTALTGKGELYLTREAYCNDFTVIEEGCGCEACSSGFTKARLNILFKEGESVGGQLVSAHNVYYLLNLMSQVRESIQTEKLDEFVSIFLRNWFTEQQKVPEWVCDALDAVDIQWKWIQ